MAGLEPAGAIPDLTKLRGSTRGSDLTQLRNSLRWILQYSYFITSQMSSDLRRGRLTGTLPVLYVFLARSGKTIREVSHVKLDENGALQPDPDTRKRVAGARREDRVRRQRRRGAHALLLQHRPVQRRRRQQQVPGLPARRWGPATAS